MVEPTLNQLRNICTLVRQAAEQVSDEGHIEYLPPFPKKWCGIVSRVLGVYLLERFPKCQFWYLCRYSDKHGSHAWIRYENVFLDITADQFDECDERIIVMDSERSKFHLQFSERDQKPRLITAADKEENPENMIYQRVCKLSKNLH